MSSAAGLTEPFRNPPAGSWLAERVQRLDAEALANATIPLAGGWVMPSSGRRLDFLAANADLFVLQSLQSDGVPDGPYMARLVEDASLNLRSGIAAMQAERQKGRRKSRSKHALPEAPRRPGRQTPMETAAVIGFALISWLRYGPMRDATDNAIYQAAADALGPGIRRGHVRTLDRRWCKWTGSRAEGNALALAIHRLCESSSPEFEALMLRTKPAALCTV